VIDLVVAVLLISSIFTLKISGGTKTLHNAKRKLEAPKLLSPALTTIGISMPADFPYTSYESIHNYCRPKMTSLPPLADKWAEYMYAWNSIAYRFRAITEHDESFSEAITKNSHFDHYVQERELFNFFVAGLSTLETFSYGLYFLASIAHPNDFPVTNPRSINLKTTKQYFLNTFPSETVTSRLDALINDPKFDKWCSIRNVLAHRSAPGRIIEAGDGGASDDIWKLDKIPLNENTTGLRRKWLSQTLGQLLEDSKKFVEQHL
jgi:hypothetical protein